MNIYEKLLKVQEAVGRVPKNGYNSFQKYNYVTEADLLDAIRKHMVEQGLALVMIGMQEKIGCHPAPEGKEGKRWAEVKIAFAVYNVANPEEKILTDSVGYAEDSGDKAIYKAITGATKYLHYKLFMVSTGDDPEREEQPAKPKAAAQRAAAPATKQAPQPVQAGGAPSPIALKSQIRAEMTKQGLNAEQVSIKTGVPGIFQLDDPKVLVEVLEVLKAG